MRKKLNKFLTTLLIAICFANTVYATETTVIEPTRTIDEIVEYGFKDWFNKNNSFDEYKNIKDKKNLDINNQTNMLDSQIEQYLHENGVLDEEILAFGQSEIDFIKAADLSNLIVYSKMGLPNNRDLNYDTLEWVDKLYEKLFFAKNETYEQTISEVEPCIKYTVYIVPDEENNRFNMLTTVYWLTESTEEEVDTIIVKWSDLKIRVSKDDPYDEMLSVKTRVCKTTETNGKSQTSWEEIDCQREKYNKLLFHNFNWSKELGRYAINNNLYDCKTYEGLCVYMPIYKNSKDVRYNKKLVSIFAEYDVESDDGESDYYLYFYDYKEQSEEKNIFEGILGKAIIIVILLASVVVVIKIRSSSVRKSSKL